MVACDGLGEFCVVFTGSTFLFLFLLFFERVCALCRVLACCPSASGFALAWARALLSGVGHITPETRVLIDFVVLSLIFGCFPLHVTVVAGH